MSPLLTARMPLLVAGATLLAIPVVAVVLGLGPGLLVLAGGALVLAVFLLWSSIERLSGESPLTFEEAMGLGAPTAEEERKRAVVRALKDLEYERSVGKITDEDFAELSTRYRAEAKTLLRALDEGLSPLRKRAEGLLEKRLSALPAESGIANDEKVVAPADGGAGGSPQGGSSAREPAPPPVAALTCEKCSTLNDADARFCKKCAAPLSPEPESGP